MRRLLCAALLLGLAGCVEVGPDYQPPQVSLTRDGFVGAANPQVSADPLPAGWWRLYDDAILDRLEQDALAANVDLRLAAARLARAAAVASEAEGARDPHLAADFAAERTQLSGQSFLLPAQLPSQYLGDGGVHVAYQLDLFGRLARAAEAAAADQQAAAAGLELARVSVAAEVARSYVEACAAGHELAAAEAILALQRQNQAVIAKLAAAGRDSVLAVSQAKIQLAQAEAALPGFRARQRLALYRLAVLTGRQPAQFPAEVEQCRQPPRLDRPIPVGDGAALLRRRPDLRQAERSLAAANARIGAATAALYPDIRLGLTAGATGLLTDLGQPSAQYWGVGPLISWSLPDQASFARIDAAKAVNDAALAQFDGTILTALREVESALAVYAQDLDRQTALSAARANAAALADQAEQLHALGRSPYLSGLSARQSLAAADQSLALIEDQLAQDQVALFLALGGGW